MNLLLQVRMTYNSNHMEGSKLSEDQTRLIFETNTINMGDGISVDDILETVHHFRAIDYCIDIAEKKLTEEIIKNCISCLSMIQRTQHFPGLQ